MQWWARLPGATQDPHWRHRWNKFGSKESGRMRATADKYFTNCSWLVEINRSDILVNPSNLLNIQASGANTFAINNIDSICLSSNNFIMQMIQQESTGPVWMIVMKLIKKRDSCFLAIYSWQMPSHRQHFFVTSSTFSSSAALFCHQQHFLMTDIWLFAPRLVINNNCTVCP